MFGLGTQELLVILVIVLVMFGGSKLPEIARSLGKSMNEFKKGINEGRVGEGKGKGEGREALMIEHAHAHEEQEAIEGAEDAEGGHDHREDEHGA